MSEQPQGTSPYDPDEDPDAQPESLNPREGDQARSSDGDVEGDTDADPDTMNPRSTLEEPPLGDS
jgi:hypothetical protein